MMFKKAQALSLQIPTEIKQYVDTIKGDKNALMEFDTLLKQRKQEAATSTPAPEDGAPPAIDEAKVREALATTKEVTMTQKPDAKAVQAKIEQVKQRMASSEAFTSSAQWTSKEEYQTFLNGLLEHWTQYAEGLSTAPAAGADLMNPNIGTSTSYGSKSSVFNLKRYASRK